MGGEAAGLCTRGTVDVCWSWLRCSYLYKRSIGDSLPLRSLVLFSLSLRVAFFFLFLLLLLFLLSFLSTCPLGCFSQDKVRAERGRDKELNLACGGLDVRWKSNRPADCCWLIQMLGLSSCPSPLNDRQYLLSHVFFFSLIFCFHSLHMSIPKWLVWFLLALFFPPRPIPHLPSFFWSYGSTTSAEFSPTPNVRYNRDFGTKSIDFGRRDWERQRERRRRTLSSLLGRVNLWFFSLTPQDGLGWKRATTATTRSGRSQRDLDVLHSWLMNKYSLRFTDASSLIRASLKANTIFTILSIALYY